MRAMRKTSGRTWEKKQRVLKENARAVLIEGRYGQIRFQELILDFCQGGRRNKNERRLKVTMRCNVQRDFLTFYKQMGQP